MANDLTTSCLHEGLARRPPKTCKDSASPLPILIDSSRKMKQTAWSMLQGLVSERIATTIRGGWITWAFGKEYKSKRRIPHSQSTCEHFQGDSNNMADSEEGECRRKKIE